MTTLNVYNINELKEKYKNQKLPRKDSVKRILSEDELYSLENYYGFDTDFNCWLFSLEHKNISFKLKCSCCGIKLTKKQIESNIKHKTGFYCSRKCNPNYNRDNKIPDNFEKFKCRYSTDDIKVIKLAIKKESKFGVIPKCRCTICNTQLNYGQFKNSFGKGINQNQTITCKNCSKIKFIKTCQNKFGGPSPMSSKEIQNKVRQTTFNNTGYFTVLNSDYVNICKSSKGEKEIFEYIKSKYTGKIYSEYWKIINPYQLDIYIPELKLAIEFNGDYYHSVVCLKENSDKQLRKTILCESKGIRLLHIWEHEWNNNKEYIKYVLDCYLNNKIPNYKCYTKLNRDYFSTLDFPGYKIVEPTLEKSGNFDVYKTGYILIN